MYACLPERSMGSLSADFCTWSDSPVKELSSIFRSFPWIRIPSAGRRSPERGNKSGTNKYPVISRASLIYQKAFTVPTSNAILHRVHYQQMSSHCDLWKCEHYSKNTLVLIHTFLILGELSLISAFIQFPGSEQETDRIWPGPCPQPPTRRRGSGWRLHCAPQRIAALARCGSAVPGTVSLYSSRWKPSPAPHKWRIVGWPHLRSILLLPPPHLPLLLTHFHKLQRLKVHYYMGVWNTRFLLINCCWCFLLLEADAFQMKRFLTDVLSGTCSS